MEVILVIGAIGAVVLHITSSESNSSSTTDIAEKSNDTRKDQIEYHK